MENMLRLSSSHNLQKSQPRKKTQPEKASQPRKSFIVKDLRIFTTKSMVVNYFETFGEVNDVSLLHTDAPKYTRSAMVLMESGESVREIRNQAEHIIDGRHVTLVDENVGLSEHLENYVEGDFTIKFTSLFERVLPISENQQLYDQVAQEAYVELDDLLYRFGYTSIRFSYGDDLRFNGCVRVTFLDDRDKSQIQIAASAFVMQDRFRARGTRVHVPGFEED